ncbi:MAG: hypothetical protein MI749_08125 [Desulfovibrionales bacterium]|nr:hypothetical protein [Desulfovibrionales bacterium]
MDSFFVVLACVATVVLVILSLLKKHNELRDVLATLDTENNSLDMRKSSYEAEIGSLNQHIASLTKEYMTIEQELAEKRQAENEQLLEKERYKYMSFIEYLIAKGYVSDDDIKKAEAYKAKNVSSMAVDEVLILFNRVTSDQLKGMREEYRLASGT